MIFEIDNNKTTASAITTNRLANSKKHSLISRQTFTNPLPSSATPTLSSSPSSSVCLNKRRPLLQRSSNSSASSNSCCGGHFGELAGGTAAECAAICCCCPCGLVNLLYVTIYKLPAGLCRRAFRRKKRSKKGLLPPRTKGCHCGYEGTELHVYPATSKEEWMAEAKYEEKEILWKEDREEETMMKLEEEMWKTFDSAGFWRSTSQREQSPKIL